MREGLFVCMFSPVLEGLQSRNVLLRFSVSVEVRPQFLRVFFVGGRQTQFDDPFIEAHWTERKEVLRLNTAKRLNT